MTIIQKNEWICEVCGKTETDTLETFPYCDPVVVPPRDGWDYNADNKLVCPECFASSKSGNG